jgi:ribosomal protein S18 acetylase RimI-like enzyme
LSGYIEFVHYRLYTSDDFAQLYAIEEACFQPPDRFSRRYMRELLARANGPAADGACWIAEEEGQLAGFAIAEWTGQLGTVAAYIETIDIAPEQRHRGVGGELLRRIEGSAAAAGARRVWLHVSEENATAIRLYEAHAYHREGREENFYARGHAGLIYAKSLAVDK